MSRRARPSEHEATLVASGAARALESHPEHVQRRPAGPPAGPTGPQGPAGPLPTQQRIAGTASTVASLAAGARAVFTVNCPNGRTAMGGGGQIIPTATNTSERNRLVLQSSFPLDADTWQIAVIGLQTIDSATRAFQVTPFVICT